MKNKISYCEYTAEQIKQISAVIRGIENLRRIRDYDNKATESEYQRRVTNSFNAALVALNELVAALAEQITAPEKTIYTEDSGK